ncbi:hypothetical protein ABVT39_012398 [Epinephelus coioides]
MTSFEEVNALTTNRASTYEFSNEDAERILIPNEVLATTMSCDELKIKLERLRQKETRLGMHASALSEYWRNKKIHRDLHIQKAPTIESINEYKEKLHATKLRKYKRDTEDYLKNEVYEWETKAPSLQPAAPQRPSGISRPPPGNLRGPDPVPEHAASVMIVASKRQQGVDSHQVRWTPTVKGIPVFQTSGPPLNLPLWVSLRCKSLGSCCAHSLHTFSPEFQNPLTGLRYEGFLMPTSPPYPEDVITITIHHANTLHDMITAFSDAEILNKAVNVKRILPDNTEEAGSGSGVMRDVLSCFWHEFYERSTLGTVFKVPFIQHDFPAETWKAIGRIILKGYQDCPYLPNKLALPFLEQVLFNCVYNDLKVHFLQFVSREERDILMQAMSDFSTVDCDDLVEILDSYGCRRRITAKTLPTILDEIAHKELVQKPMLVIDCWREIPTSSSSAQRH